MHRRERQVVRGLIVSPDFELLLVRLVLSDRSFWITPGGGVEGQEDACSALIRELTEEIGPRTWQVGPRVWTRSHTFDFEGARITQHETFHWVPCAKFRPPVDMPDSHENQYFGGFKWWAADEIAASSEVFVPSALAMHFDNLCSAGIPASVVDVGV